MKSIFVLIIQENIILIDKKYSSRILLNDEVDINVISYHYAEILNMMFIVNDLSKSSHVKKKFMYCYDVYLMKIRLFNNWKQKRVFEAIFYAIDKNNNIDLILSMSELHHMETKLDYAAMSWRYEFVEQAFQINFVNEFANKLKNHDFVYVIIIQSYKINHFMNVSVMTSFVKNFDDVAKKMSSKFRKFDDVFSLIKKKR